MKVDFSGFRNFFTLNGYPKPIYNAFALASKLGTEKLGSPDKPTEEQKQQIIKLGSNSFSEGEMSNTVDFTMTNNSVILIEIY